MGNYNLSKDDKWNQLIESLTIVSYIGKLYPGLSAGEFGTNLQLWIFNYRSLSMYQLSLYANGIMGLPVADRWDNSKVRV